MTAHKATGTWDPNTAVHAATGGTSVPTRPDIPVFTDNTLGSMQRLRFASDQAVGTSTERNSVIFHRNQATSLPA